MKDINASRSHKRYNIMTSSASSINQCISICIFVFIISNVHTQETTDFTPYVLATCKAGIMNIKVQFSSPYYGAIHARDYRKPSCMTVGNGSTLAAFSINLLAKLNSSDNCGVLVSNVSGDKTEERSIQLAVRVHKTLELADDKFYVITCGKTGFARDDNSAVALKFMDKESRRVRETVYQREYTVKAEVTNPNGTYGIRIKSCFAFGKRNESTPLIDDRGCPVNNIITRFKSASDGQSAQAVIRSMFRYSDSSEVHIQCDVIQCNGLCPDFDDSICTGDGSYSKERGIGQADTGLLLAATTVFVLDPADASVVSPICDGGIRPYWLLWLTIALGILFLIMLLMNIFLCTAMSCSCARTEIIEKEPSIIEEYDPYRSWHGSQYGSRYSLHGREGINGINKGYTSGGSTIHSNRSLPIDSDHYAIVHSRPGSRHSGLQHNGHRRNNPPSNL